MLEKERGKLRRASGSQQPAREAPGQERWRSLEAFSRSRYTAQERDAHRRSHRIQQKVGAAVRLSQEQPSDRPIGRIHIEAWGRPRRCAGEDREKWDAGGLTANNDHTGGVEGLSVPHTPR